MAFDVLQDDEPRPRAMPKSPDGYSYHPPQTPTYDYRDPPIPPPSYRPMPDPTIPTHGGPYQKPGDPGARSGINPRPSMPQPAGFDFSNPDGVRSYFASRGVTPYASSPDYWAQKWHEFGQRDPEYYQRFLSNAEEFTGGPQQTARAMGFQPRQQGGQGLNLGWLLQLMRSRMPQAQQPGMPQQVQGQSQSVAPQVDLEQIIQQALRRSF